MKFNNPFKQTSMLFRSLILFFLTLLLLPFRAWTQKEKLPFYNEVVLYKIQDSISFPAKGAILFIGSSSFRMWKDIRNAFGDSTIINRALGGSTLPDQLNYMEDVVYPYRPRQIVIYCGENDIGSGKVGAKETTDRFKAVFNAIRDTLPDVPIVFISIKPSPSREQYLPVMKEANKMIKKYLKRQPHTRFVDVYKLMLDGSGKPRKELFGDDMLHMKPEGYAIWQKAIAPHLIKN